MNRVILVSAAVVLAVTCGCRRSPAEPEVRMAMLAPPPEDLVIATPPDLVFGRGESREVVVKIDRGDYDGMVVVRLENLSPGLRFGGPLSLAPGETRAVFTLSADADADLVSHHQVVISADGQGTSRATTFFHVTIRPRS